MSNETTGFFVRRKKTLTLYAMKKANKHNSVFSGQNITYIVDEQLNLLKGKVLAPKKLAAANEALRNLKQPFPAFLKKS